MMMALEPFFTLATGVATTGGGGLGLEAGLGGRYDSALGGAGAVYEWPLEEGGGGGRATPPAPANLGGVRPVGEGERDELESSRDGERSTEVSGERGPPGDSEGRRPSAGDGVRGTVLLLGDEEGDVGRSGDMWYGDTSGERFPIGERLVGLGLTEAGFEGADARGLISLQHTELLGADI